LIQKIWQKRGTRDFAIPVLEVLRFLKLKIKLEPEIIKKIKELCRTGLKHFHLTNLEYPALFSFGGEFSPLGDPKKIQWDSYKRFL
jgi:hypothetical protein